jgi:hypothetical protein
MIVAARQAATQKKAEKNARARAEGGTRTLVGWKRCSSIYNRATCVCICGGFKEGMFVSGGMIIATQKRKSAVAV